jgi:hypothetical protein
MRHNQQSLLTLAVIAVAAVAFAANGALLIDEPFAVGTEPQQYTDGGDLGSQSAYGDGLTGSWNERSDIYEDWDTISGGLAHASVAATDGMVRLTRANSGSSGKSNGANTSLSSGNDQTYWVAFLMSFSTHNGQRIHVDFGGNALGVGINSSGHPGIGAGSALTTNSSITLAVDTTYLFVAKIDGTGNTTDGDAEDQYLWIDPDPTNEPDTAFADVYRGSGNRFGLTNSYPRSVTLHALAENGEQRYWDEIQVATSYGELNLVPEPTSLAWLLLGGASLLANRRRH